MARGIVSKVISEHAKLSHALITRGPVLCIAIIGVVYTVLLLGRLEKDTTNITNAAFAILATLSGLSFSCSRALSAESKDKDRLAYAGELFLFGAVMLLAASLIKYGVLELRGDSNSFGRLWVYYSLSPIVGIMVSLLFFFGLNIAHTGFRILSDILWIRAFRYPDWDCMFGLEHDPDELKPSRL